MLALLGQGCDRLAILVKLPLKHIKHFWNMVKVWTVYYSRDPSSHHTPTLPGGESLTRMEGVRSNLNFVGCLQQLTFNKIQMLKEAKSESLGYSVHGRLEWMCSDIQLVREFVIFKGTFWNNLLNKCISMDIALRSYTHAHTCADPSCPSFDDVTCQQRKVQVNQWPHVVHVHLQCTAYVCSFNHARFRVTGHSKYLLTQSSVRILPCCHLIH